MIEKKRDMLAAILRKNILSGKYGPEGGLPPESELVKETGFARQTVKTALLLLEGERLIAQRGHVYHVNSLPIVMTQYVPLPGVRQSGKMTYARNLSSIQTRHPLPRYLAEEVHVDPSILTTYCERLVGEYSEGKEIPMRLSYRYSFLPLTNEQIQHMERDATYDPAWDLVETLHSYDETSVRPGTPEELALLELPPGTSIQALHEQIRDEKGQLVMVHESVLSPRHKLIFGFAFMNKPEGD